VRPPTRRFVRAKASIAIPSRLEHVVEVLDIKQENGEFASGWHASQE